MLPEAIRRELMNAVDEIETHNGKSQIAVSVSAGACNRHRLRRFSALS
jgi:hypothetical protein